MRERAEAEWINLIEGIAQGSQAALAQFYDLTSSQVFGLVLRIVGKRSAAEEITLEVFTSVWKRAGQYRARDGTPSSWLLDMARRRAIGRRRSETGRDHDGRPTFDAQLLEPAATPRQDGSGAKHRHAIRKALATIHPRQRAAIELAYFSGMTCIEIADNLAEPLGRVKDSIRLGMVELRQALRSQEN